MITKKKIGGKTYRVSPQKFKTKKAAKKAADTWRKKGGKARIVKSGKGYKVWAHSPAWRK